MSDTDSNIPTEGLNPNIPVDPKMSFPEDPRASGGPMYHASKVLAHRATLSWTETNKPSFNVITLHPSFVFGHNLTQSNAAAIDGTNAMLWVSLTGPQPIIPMSGVDVRDVATAHIKVLEVDLHGTGVVEEFLLSAGEKEGWTWDRVAEFVKRRYPAVNVKLEGPFGVPPSVDSSKARDLLGVQWRGMEDTIGAFLDQQMQLRSQL